MNLTKREPETAAQLSPHPVLTRYYLREGDRRKKVDEMFDASAPHYEWVTGMMSFGSGRSYRARALRRHGLEKGMSLLDTGSGTGALAMNAQEGVGSEGRVIALDPSKGMLAEARGNGVETTIMGLAESIPFNDGQFDMVTMGYALRHVADLEQTFAEYRRVLRPGGKVLLLEITCPRNRAGFHLLRFYMRGVVPLITRLLRRSAEAQVLMRYYWDTIEHCVPPETILSALEKAGFGQVNRNSQLGIFSEYTGIAR